MSLTASTRRPPPAGYSTAQIALHWLVVLLLPVQLSSREAMEDHWDRLEDGANAALGDDPLALFHAVSGITIFVAVIGRLVLRMRHGAPVEPADLNPILRLGARISHWALYALLLVLPFAGAGAVFGGWETLGDLHSALVPALWALAVLHILAALVFHGIVRRDGVLMRMMKPG